MTVGDLIFRVLVVAVTGGLVSFVALLALRLDERSGDGVAIERREHRARGRWTAVRCALLTTLTVALLTTPVFVWPDMSLRITAALIVLALLVSQVWTVQLIGGLRWATLFGAVGSIGFLIGGLWLFGGSMVATRAEPGRLEQDASLATIREIGEAWEAWRSDHVERGAPIQDGASLSGPEDAPDAAPAVGSADAIDLSALPPLHADALAAALTPDYLERLPRADGWGRPIELRGTLGPELRLAMRSPGRDGSFSTDVYRPGLLAPTALDDDLVWLDGRFVRQPGR